ncbi:MAG: hypothetical protein U1E89_03515 [Burkholderiaceae bacterium]
MSGETGRGGAKYRKFLRKKPMPTQESLSARSSARRKLIRGSFAAPAVLMLHSGASMAAASVNSCLKRQNQHPMTQPVAMSDDLWFRYQLWGWVKPSGEVVETSGYWIKGSDLADFDRRNNRVWLNRNRYQRFDTSGNSLANVEYVPPKGPDGCTMKKVNRWVSLRVDRDGNIVGAGRTGYDSSAVSASCWNSFVLGSGV